MLWKQSNDIKACMFYKSKVFSWLIIARCSVSLNQIIIWFDDALSFIKLDLVNSKASLTIRSDVHMVEATVQEI